MYLDNLSKVSEEWKQKVGEGTAVQWPVGLGGKGNEGVSAFVQRMPGSIGYVEYAYAKQNKMAHTMMQNAAGAFVAPDDVSFKAAAAGADWAKSAFYQIDTATGQVTDHDNLHPDPRTQDKPNWLSRC
jgi:phosphate transport system substrate-binding protein